MRSFEFNEVLATHAAAGKPWLEFLRVSSLSTGIYRLPAGSVDPQRPHTEDEVYYVISGRCLFTCQGETTAAEPGSII